MSSEISEVPHDDTRAQMGPIETGYLVLDPRTRRVTIGGEPVQLSRVLYALLEKLALHKGTAVPSAELSSDDRTANSLVKNISRLRSVFARKGAVCLINTVRGRGYQLQDAPAESLD